jgi:uncharacterized Zn finger protein|tara:strand:- start:126 stop:299 length:174 start_codon:yes stop_codon:yes gene_type:complete
MAGYHQNTDCPSCGNEQADYFYDSHDRQVIIDCDKCGYTSVKTMPIEFELRRRGELA